MLDTIIGFAGQQSKSFALLFNIFSKQINVTMTATCFIVIIEYCFEVVVYILLQYPNYPSTYFWSLVRATNSFMKFKRQMHVKGQEGHISMCLQSISFSPGKMKELGPLCSWYGAKTYPVFCHTIK